MNKNFFGFGLALLLTFFVVSMVFTLPATNTMGANPVLVSVVLLILSMTATVVILRMMMSPAQPVTSESWTRKRMKRGPHCRSGKIRLTLLEGIILLMLPVILFLAFFRGVFVGEDQAVSHLKTQGFSDVRVQDKVVLAVWLRGGESSDAARFECSAKNPRGERVKVYVFVGWPFKGATIRRVE